MVPDHANGPLVMSKRELARIPGDQCLQVYGHESPLSSGTGGREMRTPKKLS